MSVERELAELAAGLEHARAERGGLYLLAGEPGIGKTKLAQEIGQRAAARGFSVTWGRCWEVGGAPAFWPWIQILRSLARADIFKGDAEPIRAALRSLLPELAEKSSLRESDLAEARFRLFDSMSSILRDLARARSLALVLDDHTFRGSVVARVSALSRPAAR